MRQWGHQAGPLDIARFGTKHRFHDETSSYGTLSEDCREFIKTEFGGRLSVITENKVHSFGVHNYVAQFTQGELSSADGVGFIFSPKLPSSKNIQRIVSIFVSRAGRICMRANSEVKRSDVGVQPFEVGDLIEVTVDLQECTAKFTIWPKDGSAHSSAVFAFGSTLLQVKQKSPNLPMFRGGYLACVVKNTDVGVRLAS
jgi:hypothetical protein